MNIMDTCGRCDGSGADPRQSYFDDEIELCGVCRGDGVVHTFHETEHEHALVGSRAA